MGSVLIRLRLDPAAVARTVGSADPVLLRSLDRVLRGLLSRTVQRIRDDSPYETGTYAAAWNLTRSGLFSYFVSNGAFDRETGVVYASWVRRRGESQPYWLAHAQPMMVETLGQFRELITGRGTVPGGLLSLGLSRVMALALRRLLTGVAATAAQRSLRDGAQ